MSWKSITIAVLVLIVVVVIFAAIFGGKKPAPADASSLSTSAQMFPPQYVTAPTPVLVTSPATKPYYNGVAYGTPYYATNGSTASGPNGAQPPMYATYSAANRSYSQPTANYPVYQHPNYGSGYYNPYPTYPTYQPQYYGSGSYNPYPNYPTYQSPYYGMGTYNPSANYPTYQSPYYGSGSYNPYPTYPTYQPWYYYG